MIFKTTKSKLKHYNIPPTDENHELLRKAKAAIGESYPEQALELLSTIKSKTLDIEITALSARLAELERTQRFGTESHETETREHNKINKSIILLITALEKEIAQAFEFYDKIRAALESRYETRLSQKLSNRQPVNLRLVPSTAGTTPQAANTFVQYDEGQIRGKLAEYYKDANGRLLLVGVPGAGKTTLLLQLELELLEQETTRIPVILNLARWNSTFSTLEDWIQEILPSEMGLTINKKVAGELIAQDRLILLLDGLDEVEEENREVCLEAIGIYGEDPDRHFIISSRIEEYKAATKDAPVNSQVEVGTLNYEQLIEQLEKTEQNEGSKRLLNALKEDVLLREIAEVPFYFNTLQLLFARGKYLHEFNFSAIDTDGRKKELERNFVFEMFRIINVKDYDAKSITKYLGFFASRFNREYLVDFELIHLQYSWHRLSKLEVIISKCIEYLLRILCGGMLGSMLGGMLGGMLSSFFGVFVSMLEGFIGVFSGFIIGGTVGGMFGGLINEEPENPSNDEDWYKNPSIAIRTKENIKWSWKTIINWENLLLCLILCLFIYLMTFTPLFNQREDLGGDVSQVPKRVVGIGFEGSQNPKEELVLLLFSFLNMGLIIQILNQLEKHNSFIQINDPYERFKASAKVFYFSILQHWHLRHLLHKKGLLPKKLVPFLNDMVKCNILETTGASWRFRHRILQDYFADQWVETEFEPEQK